MWQLVRSGHRLAGSSGPHGTEEEFPRQEMLLLPKKKKKKRQQAVSKEKNQSCSSPLQSTPRLLRRETHASQYTLNPQLLLA